MQVIKGFCSLLLAFATMLTQVHGDCFLQTPQGAVRGSYMTSLHGRDFCSYQGIPYAQPPVGDLRFRNTLPAEGWEGELNATQDGNMCVQTVLTLTFGKEDCLYLNVYTPKSDGELLPVLVFIHGGGFTFGSGTSTGYGPHYLLDQDIVMVTINYRLGILGFLSTGDDASPGNYGLRDQLEALRWINKNIASYGGDPEQVTIWGESAGGMSVHHHLLSPLSKDLFHRGISDSGTTLMPIMFEKNPLARAQERAQELQCPIEDTQELVSCLRNMDIDELTSKRPSTYSPDFELPSSMLSLYDPTWRPCAEVESEGNPEPFLPAEPQEIIRSGNFNRVPYMLGTNSHEGSLFLIFFIGTQVALDNLNANFDSLARTFFFLNASVEEAQIPEVLEAIADFYLGEDHTVTPNNVQLLMNAGTDRFMQHHHHKTVQMHLASDHQDVYLYNFGYRGKYTLLTPARYENTSVGLGVLHVDELEYCLSSGLLTDKWSAGHPDLEVVETMVTLLTNFMKHGNPTPPGQSAPQGVTWPTAGANEGQETYYVFGHDETSEPIEGIKPLKITIEPDKFKDRMDFWDSLSLKENKQ